MNARMCRAACGLLAGLLGTAWAQPAGVHTRTQTTLGQQVVLRPDAPAISPVQTSKAMYVLHCAGCHGFDGRGVPGGRVPDLRQVGHFLRVPGGREFLAQVPGVLASGLDDAQVAQVSNWLLATLAAGSVPAEHQPYDGQEIARLRRQPPADVAAVRAALSEQAQRRGWPVAAPY